MIAVEYANLTSFTSSPMSQGINSNLQHISSNIHNLTFAFRGPPGKACHKSLEALI